VLEGKALCSTFCLFFEGWVLPGFFLFVEEELGARPNLLANLPRRPSELDALRDVALPIAIQKCWSRRIELGTVEGRPKGCNTGVNLSTWPLTDKINGTGKRLRSRKRDMLLPELYG
jgi:hypothetical protein